MAIAYPITAFHFEVDWGGSSGSFTEVSGLTRETELIEYRTGDMKEYSKVKMPGMQKYSNLTLKRGIVPADNEFMAWLTQTKMNKPERRDITVKLLNEEHVPVATWVAKNCFPIKVEGPGLKADGNEVAIESIEIAHEGITLTM